MNDKILRIVNGFNFDLTLESTTLGEDCAHIIADEIANRSANSRGAENYWAENEEPYRSWKAKKYGVSKPNVRTGQMLNLQALLGEFVVTTDQVAMFYGTVEAPARSSASSYFDPKTDGAITDVEKAWYCSTSHNRPFYELDDNISTIIFEHIENTLAEYLQRQ